MIATSRRSLITGLVALVAAPAIVKVASLMPVNVALQPGGNALLTIDQVTREAVRLFQDDNLFLEELAQYDVDFGMEGAKIGSTLRIRLPSDYDCAMHFSARRLHHEAADFQPSALGVAALAVAAAPLVGQALHKPVTRRF